MVKLYKKSEIAVFAVLVVVYIIGNSLADSISASIGIDKVVTLFFDLIILIFLMIFIKRLGLEEYYGFCKSEKQASKFLYYLPLVFIASVNWWFGLKMNMPFINAICYVISMLLVGVIEELIFRGFLFKAMSKENVRTAIIVSSLTFGIGHIVNLINGSGNGTLETICQLFYAVALGFLFVIIFYKGKSIIPCMVAHSFINASSAFGNEELANKYMIPVSIVLCIVSFVYAWIILDNTYDENRA